jgi:hypothetical protein
MDLGGGAEMATLEGFLHAMERRVEAASALAGQAQAARGKQADLEAGLSQLDGTLVGLREKLAEAEREEKTWLQRQGVANPQEYALQVSRLLETDAQCERKKSELEALAQGQDHGSFRREVLRKLQALDEEGIPGSGQDEAALQRLKNARQSWWVKKEAEAQREREMIARKEGLAGEIRGALGKLAGEIVAGEESLAIWEAEIAVKERDKRASALAMGIFREIGEGADLLLAGLAREMEAMLARILPEGRGLDLQGLDHKQIRVMDAGGADRPMDSLSTGTRDTVVLAAKLALARKHREGAGILVLDDPFLAMDERREARALALLADFHRRHGWQIILLTKEVRLKTMAGGIFTHAKVIELVPGNRNQAPA